MRVLGYQKMRELDHTRWKPYEDEGWGKRAEAASWEIPVGYSMCNWDPRERPIFLLGMERIHHYEVERAKEDEMFSMEI